MSRKVGVRRVIPLTLGWERIQKKYSVHGDMSGETIVEPVPGVLLECDGGFVLLDTGFNPALIRDPPLCRRFHDPDRGVEAIVAGDGDPLKAALDEAAVPIDAIDAVAISHLHNDHVGGVRHFAGLAPVHVQRAELSYGLSSPDAERNGMYRIDFDDPALDWQLADGETEIASGVIAVLTAGHTPGHQSFIVEYDESVGSGGFVFAFDAADLTENIEGELPVGSFIDCEAADTVEPIRRLKAIARERGLLLVPGHDPVAWPRLTRQLADAGGQGNGRPRG
ncbi:MAG: N-acyl homoserine lactonase family protein [Streptosporangiaceae bacterium]